MNEEQKSYIQSINQSTEEDIMIKKTGWEDIKVVPHTHPKTQIIYTLSGTLHVQTDKENFFVPEKHIAWIPANMVHDLSTNNRQGSLIIFYVSLYENEKDTFSIYSSNGIIAENIRYISNCGPIINKQNQTNLYHYASSFFRMLPEMSPNRGIPLKTITIPNDPRLTPVLNYMQEHACGDLRIEQVAHEFGFSVRNLSRLLNRSGIRFSNYLNTIRITRAIEIFAEQKNTIQETAFATGFSTPSNFDRVFKQVTGTTPGEFLKNKP